MSTTSHPFFVENASAGSRQDTATLLVGTADEFGISQRSVRTTSKGFYITEELAKAVYGEDALDEQAEGDDAPSLYDPADHKVDEVQSHVTAHPEQAEAVLASEEEGKNRSTLVEWLTEFIETSGNRAAKTGTDKE